MAPDLDGFAALARAAYDELPDELRAFVGEVEIRVDDWPTDEALASVDVDEPLGLLGLFEGIGLSEGGSLAPTGAFPNRVWLYREPILVYAQDTGERVADVVRHVLVHEIGHHFGLSDDDMEAIDNAPD